MVKAIIHVMVEPRNMNAVLDKLLESGIVERVYEVTGEYDLIAVVEVPSYEAAARFVREELHPMEGVLRTVTSLVVEEHRAKGGR